MTVDVFEAHPLERALYEPLVGTTMLELGNKEWQGASYKDYFTALGFRHTSVDINGLNGARPLDLQEPLNLGTFDMVSNIGTTEHVRKQPPVWRNICEAMHIGSVFVSTTPHPAGWPQHGMHHPTQAFYQSLADLNGLEVERLFDAYEGKLIFARLRRVEDRPFKMPSGGLIK